MSAPLDLEAFEDAVARSDDSARAAAHERQLTLAKPPGSLGHLEDLAAWLCGVQSQCPPRPLDRVHVVVFAGDHGIARAGVSTYPSDATPALVRRTLAGGTPANAIARVLDASVRVVDICVDELLDGVPADVTRHKVRRGTGRIDREDACSREEIDAALRAGIAVADEEIDSGVDLLVLGDVGVASTTPAAVLTGLLTASDAASVVGRGSGIDDRAWMRKTAAVRDAMRRSRKLIGDLPGVLATGAGPQFAAMTGFLLQAAQRRTPVVLDGVVATASALAAHRIAFRASDWWVAGQLTAEPAHRKAVQTLSLTPALKQGVWVGEGAGALLAVPLLRAAQATLAETAARGE